MPQGEDWMNEHVGGGAGIGQMPGSNINDLLIFLSLSTTGYLMNNNR